MKVVLQDARVFTKRANLRDERYDLIMLDAFNGDYIPEHLMTAEYLEETQALLAPGGVVASNTFAISRLYDHESATYRQVFGEFFNLRSRSSSNRIILAKREPLPDPKSLSATARSFNAALRPYQVNLNQYVNQLSTKIDWDQEARILTDQYAPANLLRDQ
jgi:spermidine synthase